MPGCRALAGIWERIPGGGFLDFLENRFSREAKRLFSVISWAAERISLILCRFLSKEGKNRIVFPARSLFWKFKGGFLAVA